MKAFSTSDLCKACFPLLATTMLHAVPFHPIYIDSPQDLQRVHHAMSAHRTKKPHCTVTDDAFECDIQCSSKAFHVHCMKAGTKDRTKGYQPHLYNQPHGFKAIRLYPVAPSTFGHQDGHNGALLVPEAHDIGGLTLLTKLQLHEPASQYTLAC